MLGEGNIHWRLQNGKPMFLWILKVTEKLLFVEKSNGFAKIRHIFMSIGKKQ